MWLRTAESTWIVALLCGWCAVAAAEDPQRTVAPRPLTMEPHRAPASPEAPAETRKEAAATIQAPSIATIQQALSRLGYDPGPADGRMGTRTRGAIAAYEKAKGWPPSGLIDQHLYDGLANDLAGGEEVSPPEGANRVEAATTLVEPTGGVEMEARPPTAPTRRAAAYTEESRRVAEAEQRSALETAVVEFFNALRDMSIFIVRSFLGTGGATPATELAGSD